ncbi:MAG: divalent-cation tolerance protein CutA [Desulfobacteraceae bacterium]|nr:divalent-cation tolerance protein CutA [Desulfobacteraceae bacterium]MCB9494318.1 divalent-cation tolerance protein CutA [Desulfobacteraceae bacterium]
MKAKIVYITAKNNDEAQFIAMDLVNQNLAACVNIIGTINSFYKWNNKVENNFEVALIAKTTSENESDLIEHVKKIHSYEVPCIISFDISSGNSEFVKWIFDSIAN